MAKGVAARPIAEFALPVPEPEPPELEPDDEVGKSVEVAPVAVVRLLALFDNAANPIAVGLYRKTLRDEQKRKCQRLNRSKVLERIRLTSIHSSRTWHPRSTE